MSSHIYITLLLKLAKRDRKEKEGSTKRFKIYKLGDN
jgi:hypothetical protein